MNVSNKKWLLASLLFFVIVYGLSFAVQHPANNDHEIILTDVGFDTPVLLHAQCTEEEFDRYTEIVKEIYQTNHKRFDIYHEYPDIHNVYTVNQQAGTQPVSIDSTTLSGIELAIQMNRETGAYDPSIGSLLSLWHQYREQGKSDEKKAQLPPDQDIREALQHGGCDKIMINGDQISFTDPQLQLDLGGIAKGYVTQLAKEALEKAGCRHGFINAGGNVVLIGNKEDGSPWTIGIQNPDSANSIVAVTAEEDQTFVTSGDYQRYYTVEGKRYSHIIDPKTGMPADTYRSVSVITKQPSGVADAYSTALFCMDFPSGQAFAEEHDIDVIWIFDKDKAPDQKPEIKSGQYYIYTTKGIRQQITQ